MLQHQRDHPIRLATPSLVDRDHPVLQVDTARLVPQQVFGFDGRVDQLPRTAPGLAALAHGVGVSKRLVGVGEKGLDGGDGVSGRCEWSHGQDASKGPQSL